MMRRAAIGGCVQIAVMSVAFAFTGALCVLGSGCSDAKQPESKPIEGVEPAQNADNAATASAASADELIAQEVARFRSLSGQLIELGGLDAAGATPENLRARIELIPTIIDEIDRLDRTLPALLRSLPEPMPAEDIGLVGQIRNTDRAMMAAGFELLSIYEDHYGEWKVTPEGIVEFDGLPDEDIRRVNVLLNVMSQAAMEQARLQQTYLTRQNRP